ncbi:hypothetical protein MKA53_08850 [[Clostridium] innocuum]|nr:hypothetical protein [[Clostridium] innocuum]
MKKILFALFTFSLLLSGCAQKIEDPAEASAAYPWIIATDSPKDTVTGLFAHKFAEEVERLSNGSIHMQVYENGTLGSDRCLFFKRRQQGEAKIQKLLTKLILKISALRLQSVS